MINRRVDSQHFYFNNKERQWRNDNMCGVFAYMGDQSSIKKVVSGLQRLEYRGYDSWGIAFPLNDRIEIIKSLEPLKQIDTAGIDLAVSYALGHTRWATHGAVNINNCHPHVSSCGDFALVHNGIVENFQSLKTELTKTKLTQTKLNKEAELFNSETDTEVIVRLIERELKLKEADSPRSLADYQSAFIKAFNQLEGFNTIVLIGVKQQFLIGIRNGSPLIAGKKDNELFLASDYHAFANHTNQCLLIDERQMICCEKDKISLYDLALQKLITPDWQTLISEQQVQSKQGFQHYMLKEMSEQWQTIINASRLDPVQLDELVTAMKNASRIYLTGAGAAYFVAEQIAYCLRTIATISVTAVAAYEATSYLPEMQAGDLLLAVSQSGETADTLRFIQQAKNKKVLIASIVNMPGAMMSRLSDFAFFSQSGAEVCVLSTKTSSAQLTFGYLLAHSFKQAFNQAKQQIENLGQQLSHYFSHDSLQDFVELAEKIKGDDLYLLGQGKYLASAKIGALNVKEASYIHAEAFSAGELKHGVIALIKEGTPVICFVDDSNQDYMISIASEVKARGGMIIGICQTANPIFDHVIIMPAADNPASVVTSIIPCQLLAYYLAVKRDLNPDKPRNLAKSVTVI